MIIIALTAALAGQVGSSCDVSRMHPVASVLFIFQVLYLDWRPMLRDSLFYGLSIVTFIGFSWDGLIEYHESAILLALYILYVVMMKFNSRIMALLGRCK